MGLRQTKKISELESLSSATLDTTYVVGISGSNTYKISINKLTSSLDTTFATDLVTTALSGTLDGKLSTSSFQSYTASISTASLVTSINNLNTFTASQSTSSLINRLNAIENISGSWITENETGSFLTSLNGAISSSSQLTSSYDSRYVLSGSITQTTWDNISGKPAGLVSQSTDLTSLNSFTASNSNTSLNAATSSYETKGNGIVSGSTQLTSSFDTRYTLSGSVQPLPSNLISSSAQITSFGFVSGSYLTSLSGAISSSSQLTSSFDVRYEGVGIGIVSGSTQLTSSFEVVGRGIISSSTQLPNGLISGSSQLTESFDVRYTLSGSGGSTTIPDGTVSGSSQLTASFDTRYLNTGGDGVISGSSQLTSSFETVGRGIISGSSQITGIVNLTNLSATSQISASTFVGGFGVPEAKFTVISSKPITFWPNITFESVRFTTAGGVIIGKNGETNDFGNKLDVSGSVRFIGNTTITGSLIVTNGITGSIAATNGIISGSSQLTSSLDTRYALSGSGGTIPGGTVSGSAQITTLGFATTSSLNTLTASFNSFTASAQSVTTGSNSFNGTQTITGSLIITTGSFVGSQILANTSSLYLTSGSNMYVQNNGLVEITGSLIVSGTTRFATVGGDEGGEIEFGVPQTNTTLSTRVVQDIFQNRLRIFDGNTNGVFIDLSKAPTGVNGEITWKTSGYVNAGTFVQLDNVKVTIPTSGNRGASIGAVSTSFTANISATFGNSAGTGGNAANTVSYTTTASASAFGWNFGAAGDAATYILNDTTNSRVYRIITMIGTSYNNNFISIERLH